jgi:hypothetical protein
VVGVRSWLPSLLVSISFTVGVVNLVPPTTIPIISLQRRQSLDISLRRLDSALYNLHVAKDRLRSGLGLWKREGVPRTKSDVRLRVVLEPQLPLRFDHIKGVRWKSNKCGESASHPHAAPISPSNDVAIPSFSYRLPDRANNRMGERDAC